MAVQNVANMTKKWLYLVTKMIMDSPQEHKSVITTFELWLPYQSLSWLTSSEPNPWNTPTLMVVLDHKYTSPEYRMRHTVKSYVVGTERVLFFLLRKLL